MKLTEEFKIRDLRDKFFQVDDAYFNGHAKLCGDSASLVYMMLCRHVGREQSCFPSLDRMADKLGITRARVLRGIKMLESRKIIYVKRSPGECNEYFLIDKSNWRVEPKPVIKRGPARKATKVERAGVKVTWEGDRMRPYAER